jgi:hypothetical protein
MNVLFTTSKAVSAEIFPRYSSVLISGAAKIF